MPSPHHKLQSYPRARLLFQVGRPKHQEVRLRTSRQVGAPTPPRVHPPHPPHVAVPLTPTATCTCPLAVFRSIEVQTTPGLRRPTRRYSAAYVPYRGYSPLLEGARFAPPCDTGARFSTLRALAPATGVRSPAGSPLRSGAALPIAGSYRNGKPSCAKRVAHLVGCARLRAPSTGTCFAASIG